MKKSLRSERNKRVAILSILGFVLVGLTGYYMYKAYTGELGSSAAMCKRDSYSCTCSNGTKKEIAYNFCDSRYIRYSSCKVELEKALKEFKPSKGKTAPTYSQQCANDTKIYESQRDAYIQKQCSVQCARKTPTQPQERREDWWNIFGNR